MNRLREKEERRGKEACPQEVAVKEESTSQLSLGLLGGQQRQLWPPPFQMLQARLRAGLRESSGTAFLTSRVSGRPTFWIFFLSLQGSTDRCVHPKPKSVSYMHRPLLHARRPSDRGPSGGRFSANNEKNGLVTSPGHSQEDREL